MWILWEVVAEDLSTRKGCEGILWNKTKKKKKERNLLKKKIEGKVGEEESAGFCRRNFQAKVWTY